MYSRIYRKNHQKNDERCIIHTGTSSSELAISHWEEKGIFSSLVCFSDAWKQIFWNNVTPVLVIVHILRDFAPKLISRHITHDSKVEDGNETPTELFSLWSNMVMLGAILNHTTAFAQYFFSQYFFYNWNYYTTYKVGVESSFKFTWVSFWQHT